MTEQQLDERLTAVAKDAVERFRSLRKQNDGVLLSIIRDCLLCEYQRAAAEEKERCAAIVAHFVNGDEFTGSEEFMAHMDRAVQFVERSKIKLLAVIRGAE